MRFGRRGKPVLFRIAVVLLIIATFIVVADMLMRPGVQELARNRAQLFAAQTVAQTVEKLFADQPTLLDSLIAVSDLEDGSVTSIRVNPTAANQLKNAVSLAVTGAFEPAEPIRIGIPLGTLTGLQFLAETGPEIDIRLRLLGAADIDLVSEFTDAGINQTFHRLQLVVSVEVAAVLPFYTVTAQSTTHFLAAETVIVGDVPQLFSGLLQ